MKPKPVSWAPEVLTEGKWCGNGMRFETEREALLWGADLLNRWFVPTDHRAVPSEDPVNYRIMNDNTLERVTDL